MTRVLLAALALAAACEWDYERMIDQPRFDPYEPNPFFSDGATMQTPPPGTVSRDAVLGPPALVTGAVGGAYVGRPPIRVTPAVLRRGRDRYDIFCAACHGRIGDGRTQVAENMRLRPPPSLHEPRLVAAPAGRLFAVATAGYGLMPSYAEELDVLDRWAVVAYVQTLQLSQAAELAELPPAMAEEARAWLP